jgi:hypothetical protein
MNGVMDRGRCGHRSACGKIRCDGLLYVLGKVLGGGLGECAELVLGRLDDASASVGF